LETKEYFCFPAWILGGDACVLEHVSISVEALGNFVPGGEKARIPNGCSDGGTSGKEVWEVEGFRMMSWEGVAKFQRCSVNNLD